MNGENINISDRPLRILIAPLDWGLGHTTRCIPIIQLLLQSGVSVVLAAEGAAKVLLQQEFPQLQILPLKGYKVLYGHSKKTFALKLLFQLPKIISAIRQERSWLQKAASTYQLDAVISDNRLGLSTTAIPCIYITHQLHIKTGYSLLSNWIQQKHYSFINNFDACWIPDVAGTQNLAGALSHPKVLPKVPVSYCGTLSRFSEKCLNPILTDILVILSGPEPQRSFFEDLLLPQLKKHNGSVVLVRGLPDSISTIELNFNKKVYNHLPATELERHVHGAGMVIARSGYSTVMDITITGTKAILVPTPGQTEQEYLADYLKKQGRFFTENQERFSLQESLEKANEFYKSRSAAKQLTFNSSPILTWLAGLKPVDHGQ